MANIDPVTSPSDGARPRRLQMPLVVAAAALVVALGSAGTSAWLAVRNADLADAIARTESDAAEAADRAGRADRAAHDASTLGDGALEERVADLESVTNGMVEAIRQLGDHIDAATAQPPGPGGIDNSSDVPLLESRVAGLEADLGDVCLALQLDFETAVC